MHASNLEQINAALSELQARIDSVSELIADRQQRRNTITEAIAEAERAVTAARAELEVQLAAEAMNEVNGADAARAAMQQATKALTAARKGEGVAAELLAGESGLAVRLAELLAQAVEVRRQREMAVIEHHRAVLDQHIKQYMQAAQPLIESFAAALATHELLDRQGHNPLLVNDQTRAILIPSWTGYPSDGPDFQVLLAEARQRVEAEHRKLTAA